MSAEMDVEGLIRDLQAYLLAWERGKVRYQVGLQVAIRRAKAAIEQQAEEIARLRKWQQEMVEIQASGGRLDGYREMGAKIAEQAETIERLKRERDRLPADWWTDSSLETWFPITAEEQKRLRAEVSRLSAEATKPPMPPCVRERLDDLLRWFERQPMAYQTELAVKTVRKWLKEECAAPVAEKRERQWQITLNQYLGAAIINAHMCEADLDSVHVPMRLMDELAQLAGYESIEDAEARMGIPRQTPCAALTDSAPKGDQP